MIKEQTKIEAERYIAPQMSVRAIAVRRVIAASDDDAYGNLGQLNENEEE